jgi:hypothetical protein
MAEFTHLYLNRLGHKSLNFVYAGGYLGTWCQYATPDYVVQYHPIEVAGGERDQKSGLLVQCGGDSTMGTGSALGGGGHFGFELFIFYDPADKESVRAGTRHMENAKKDAAAHGIGPGKGNAFLDVGRMDEELCQAYAMAPQPLIFHLQRRIKALLDPNDIGDRMYTWLPAQKK